MKAVSSRAQQKHYIIRCNHFIPVIIFVMQRALGVAAFSKSKWDPIMPRKHNRFCLRFVSNLLMEEIRWLIVSRVDVSAERV